MLTEIVGTMNGAQLVAAVQGNFEQMDSTVWAWIKEEFTGGGLTNGAPFATSTSGSGAAYDATVASESGHPGIAQLSTGTTTTGYTYVTSKSQSLVVFEDDAWTLRCVFKMPVLSDGTDTYTLVLGFGDTPTAAAQTDGVFLRYTHSVNSGKFQAVTESNTTETATDTGVTATADTWYRLDITVAADGSSVVFALKTGTGASTTVATNTTNIPTTATRATGILAGIVKSAGTTARTAMVDLIEARCEFGTER